MSRAPRPAVRRPALLCNDPRSRHSCELIAQVKNQPRLYELKPSGSTTSLYLLGLLASVTVSDPERWDTRYAWPPEGVGVEQ